MSKSRLVTDVPDDDVADSDIQDIPIPPPRGESIPKKILTFMAMDTISPVGHHTNPKIDEFISDYFARSEIRRREPEYSSYENITIFIGSWNINGKKGDDDILPWLSKGSTSGKPEADMYIIGFQEMVDLTASSVMSDGNSESAAKMWIHKLQESLNKTSKTKYTLIKHLFLVGVFIAIYVKEGMDNDILDIEDVNTAVGILGIMGNKGASCIRFKYKDNTFCFVCSHLAAMRGAVHERNANYHTILSKTQFSVLNEDQSPSGILDHDFSFWFGDLNYRVTNDVSTEKVLDNCLKNEIHFLLNHDQLILSKKSALAFVEFQEPTISFLPTYKYIPGTDQYENRPNKPKRAPAWCDRVLYRTDKNTKPDHLQVVEYNRAQLMASDHKPIYCIFKCSVKKYNQKKKDVVDNEVKKSMTIDSTDIPTISLSKKFVEFNSVKFMQTNIDSIKIKNTSKNIVKYYFVPKDELNHATKPWCNVYPLFGLLMPGQEESITVEVFVDRLTANDLNTGLDIFEDIMTLRTEGGIDQHIKVTGKYFRSSFGSSLYYLIRCSRPVRECPEITSDSPVLYRVPKELWRIVDYIYKNGKFTKGLFTDKGDLNEMHTIRESLDTGSELPTVSVHSMCQILLQFLSSLQGFVIPIKIIPSKPLENKQLDNEVLSILEKIPTANINVLLYIVSFIRQLNSLSRDNEISLDMIVDIFTQSLCPPPTKSSTLNKSLGNQMANVGTIITWMVNIDEDYFTKKANANQQGTGGDDSGHDRSSNVNNNSD